MHERRVLIIACASRVESFVRKRTNFCEWERDAEFCLCMISYGKLNGLQLAQYLFLNNLHKLPEHKRGMLIDGK